MPFTPIKGVTPGFKPLTTQSGFPHEEPDHVKQSFLSKLGNAVVGGVVDTGKQIGQASIGIGKSILNTGNEVSKLGQRALSIIPGSLKEPTSLPKNIITPSNNDFQKSGFLGGQIGQNFAIPGGSINEGAAALSEAAGGGKLLGGIAKVGAQAVTGATTAKLQGASDKQALTSGVVSGGLQAVGSLFSNVLKNSAEKSYSQALNATTKPNKVISDKVVPELLKRRVVALTKGSLYEKAAENADKADEALTEAYSSLPKGTQSDWSSVLKKLQDEKDAVTVNGVVMDQGKYNSLHQVQADLLNVIGGGVSDAKNPSVSVESARKVRQIFDKMVRNKTFGVTGAESEKLAATKEAANAIRSQLAVEHPNIDAINKEFNFWKNVQDVMGATIQRTKGQTSLTGEMAQDAGGIIGSQQKGGIGNIIKGSFVGKLLHSAIKSTGWKTVSAVTKNELAKAMASGDAAKVTSLIQTITNQK